jgi:hypothetical protein
MPLNVGTVERHEVQNRDHATRHRVDGPEQIGTISVLLLGNMLPARSDLPVATTAGIEEPGE